MSLTLWRSCATGKYSNVAGATACVDCAAGKYASSTGNDAETDCVACAAGADACLAVLYHAHLYLHCDTIFLISIHLAGACTRIAMPFLC